MKPLDTERHTVLVHEKVLIPVTEDVSMKFDYVGQSTSAERVDNSYNLIYSMLYQQRNAGAGTGSVISDGGKKILGRKKFGGKPTGWAEWEILEADVNRIILRMIDYKPPIG